MELGFAIGAAHPAVDPTHSIQKRTLSSPRFARWPGGGFTTGVFSKDGAGSAADAQGSGGFHFAGWFSAGVGGALALASTIQSAAIWVWQAAKPFSGEQGAGDEQREHFLRGGDLLGAHTPESAGNLLDETITARLIERTRQQIARDALRRRPRSCQRKVRQPVKKWPRMLALPPSLPSLSLTSSRLLKGIGPNPRMPLRQAQGLALEESDRPPLPFGPRAQGRGALSRGPGNCAVGVNDRLLWKAARLLFPDARPHGG